MSIQRLLQSFRSSLAVRSEEINLEDEIALYRKRANLAFGEERYNDALVFLAKILRLNPYDLTARMVVAEIYHRHLHEPTKAVLTYEKVIATAGYDESNPFCAAAHEAIRELAQTTSPVPVLALDDLEEATSPEPWAGAAASGDR